MSVRILQGHVLDKLAEMPDESAHCVVTSPPYFGLRDYGIEPQVWGGEPDCRHDFVVETISTEIGKGNCSQATNGRGEAQPGGLEGKREPIRSIQERGFCACGAWRGSLGIEPTLALYLDHMIMVCREIRRVLRSDGTFWLNVGDSYAGSWGAQSRRVSESDDSSWHSSQIKNHPKRASNTGTIRDAGLKPKDLMMMPARLAIRLQEDGWYLRSDICWSKAAPMPESVRDRPTSAHEHIFLLTKSPRYFYDAEAVKEPASYLQPNAPDAIKSPYGQGFTRRAKGNAKTFRGGGAYTAGQSFDNSATVGRQSRGNAPNESLTRNMRDVWHLGPEPYPEAHFATFVTEIPRRAILAGTSEKGVCSSCGAPRVRIFGERHQVNGRGAGNGFARDHRLSVDGRGDETAWIPKSQETIGWQPTCACNVEIAPATILDPFGGSGTTGLVADRLGRDAILIELNGDYTAMAKRRIEKDGGLFAEVAA